MIASTLFLMLQAQTMSNHWKVDHQGQQTHQDHQVAISIWIISIAMLASTFFLMMQAQTVTNHGKTFAGV